jgi:serine/threonine protein kinase
MKGASSCVNLTAEVCFLRPANLVTYGPIRRHTVGAIIQAYRCQAAGIDVVFQDLSHRTMTDEAEARLGTRLGNYALKEIIGRGGMGVVYRAVNIYLRKPAALKVLHRYLFDQPGAKARFLREAQTASLVEHPNIVGVTDFGEAPDGTVYLVMAEAHGVGLDLVLQREGTIPIFRTIGIVGQVTQALSAVHARGIVHRDIKPENIMLARRVGRRELVRRLRDGDDFFERIEPEECFDLVTLLDFGASRSLQFDFTAAGEPARIFGTPAYLAPETAETGEADARSDIYSVGVLLYEMLTGQLPFEGQTPAETLRMHVCAEPCPPTLRNPNVEITPEAERTVLRALEKDPAHRQASMDELWVELQRCYGSMRWRRPNLALGDALDVASVRAPDRDHPRQLRRVHPTPNTSISSDALPAAERAKPLLLTKRKSGKFAAVVSPEEMPTPPPRPVAGFASTAKSR